MLALHNILSGVWAVNPQHAADYLPLITQYIKGQPMYIVQSNGGTEQESSKEAGNGDYSVKMKNGVALIEIRGIMTKYDQFCGPQGMQTIARTIAACSNEKDIKAVILDINSPGGEMYASQTLSTAIEKCTKPVIAYINDYAYSAAYIGASAADMMIANTEFAQTGSIGVMTTIVDYRQNLEKEGIKLIELYAQQSKEKNADIREALEGNTKKLQEHLNFICEKQVINKVIYNRNRALSIKYKNILPNRIERLTPTTQWTTGKTMFAQEAVEIGLIDGIADLNEIAEWFT